VDIGIGHGSDNGSRHSEGEGSPLSPPAASPSSTSESISISASASDSHRAAQRDQSDKVAQRLMQIVSESQSEAAESCPMTVTPPVSGVTSPLIPVAVPLPLPTPSPIHTLDASSRIHTPIRCSPVAQAQTQTNVDDISGMSADGDGDGDGDVDVASSTIFSPSSKSTSTRRTSGRSSCGSSAISSLNMSMSADSPISFATAATSTTWNDNATTPTAPSENSSPHHAPHTAATNTNTTTNTSIAHTPTQTHAHAHGAGSVEGAGVTVTRGMSMLSLGRSAIQTQTQTQKQRQDMIGAMTVTQSQSESQGQRSVEARSTTGESALAPVDRIEQSRATHVRVSERRNLSQESNTGVSATISSSGTSSSSAITSTSVPQPTDMSEGIGSKASSFHPFSINDAAASGSDSCDGTRSSSTSSLSSASASASASSVASTSTSSSTPFVPTSQAPSRRGSLLAGEGAWLPANVDDFEKIKTNLSVEVHNSFRNPVHGLLALVSHLTASPALMNLVDERETVKALYKAIKRLNETVQQGGAGAGAEAGESDKHSHDNDTATPPSVTTTSTSTSTAALASPPHSPVRHVRSATIGTQMPTPTTPSRTLATALTSTSPGHLSSSSSGSLATHHSPPKISSHQHSASITNIGPMPTATATATATGISAPVASSRVPTAATTAAQRAQLFRGSAWGGSSGAATPTSIDSTHLLRDSSGTNSGAGTPTYSARTPPLGPASAMSRGVSSPSKSDLVANLHVLIVDDMSLNRKVLRRMLDQVQHVDIACDGLQAFEYVRKKAEAGLRTTLPFIDVERIIREYQGEQTSKGGNVGTPNLNASGNVSENSSRASSVAGGEAPQSSPCTPTLEMSPPSNSPPSSSPPVQGQTHPPHTYAVASTQAAGHVPASATAGQVPSTYQNHSNLLAPSLELPAAQGSITALGRIHSVPALPTLASAGTPRYPISHPKSMIHPNVAHAVTTAATEYGMNHPSVFAPISPPTPIIMPRTPLVESIPVPAGLTLPSSPEKGRRYTMTPNLRSPTAHVYMQTHGGAASMHQSRSTPSSPAHGASPKPQYDVIISDIQMPHCNGLTESVLIRHLERVAGLPHVPIIAVTSDATMAARMACARSQMDYYLPKPFSKKDVMAILELVIQQRALQHVCLASMRRAMELEECAALAAHHQQQRHQPPMQSLVSGHIDSAIPEASSTPVIPHPPLRGVSSDNDLSLLPAAVLQPPSVEREISLVSAAAASDSTSASPLSSASSTSPSSQSHSHSQSRSQFQSRSHSSTFDTPESVSETTMVRYRSSSISSSSPSILSSPGATASVSVATHTRLRSSGSDAGNSVTAGSAPRSGAAAPVPTPPSSSARDLTGSMTAAMMLDEAGANRTPPPLHTQHQHQRQSPQTHAHTAQATTQSMQANERIQEESGQSWPGMPS